MDFFDFWDFMHVLSGRRVRAVMSGLLALGLMTPTGQHLVVAAAMRRGEAISREVQHRLCATGTPMFAAFCAATPASVTPEQPTTTSPAGG